MKKMALFLTVLLSSAAAQAADYFLPHTECDGSANVRAAPDTRSKIMTVLDYESKKHKILSKQGKWFHIQLDGHRTGYVHQSQGFIVHNYVVASPDGSANVRNNSYPEKPISQGEIIKILPNGTRVQIAPAFRKGDWLWYSNQGAYTEKDEYGHHVSIQGYIHKSQLRRVE